MARPLRIQYPGAVYHITCRGNAKTDIYKDDKDRNSFLEILSESQNIHSIIIYSYVLMSNHYHLLIETPKGNLSEYMRHFNMRYTSHYNRRHKKGGHLYQGRFKGILVDKDTYLTMLSRYIHLNPVKIKGIKKMPYKEKMKYLKKYKWSSLPGYIDKRGKQEFIDYNLVLEEYGGDNEKGRRAYSDIISIDASGQMDVKDIIVGQSIIGKENFIEKVLDKYLKKKPDMREQPSLRKLHGLRVKDEIIDAIQEETGKDLDGIKKSKGIERNVLMDLLYRAGGIKGAEIGRLLEVDYSTVSQGRKRLRDMLKKDKKLKHIVGRIEGRLSR
ncbi:transposase IS200 like protein [bacterium BMS3Bbin08]|nr:transposase IS200 like protein [bacterium BMS3Bbin08]